MQAHGVTQQTLIECDLTKIGKERNIVDHNIVAINKVH